MIDAGALENPPVDAIIGLHSWPDIPAGTIGVRKGPLMAAADVISIHKKNFREIWTALKNGILALLAPLIILYGVTGGVITPTEAGVLAVVYSLIVGIVYGEFRISALPQVLYDSVLSSAHILPTLSLREREYVPSPLGGED
jgi:hypothetical protein